jgi:GTP-binding protein
MFIDQIKVYARAGHGGKGAVAFIREAYRPKGGPSGGNGGRGGDVILEASHDLNNLINQYYRPRLIAQDGEQGMGKGMDGHAGKDIVIQVPCGTLVWKIRDTKPIETDEDEDSDDAPEPRDEKMIQSAATQRPIIRFAGGQVAAEYNLADEDVTTAAKDQPKGELVADLTENGQRFILCKAGRGGLGNRNFATAARQSPRFAQPGEAGDEGEYLFELRTIADIGLVGYPNAGKSTLLTAVSKARPKVAPYPFTTLHPQIGVMEFPDFRRLVVCDVPGLIEGAHENVGLGHAFLRHIQRCKVLVILLDMAGTDAREPWDDYHQLLHELELYDPAMLDKPRLVVANKIDEPAAETNLKTFKKKVKKVPVLPISAAFDEGMDKLRQELRDAVEAVEEADRVKKAKDAEKAARAEARRLAAGIPAPSARNLKRKQAKKK